MLTCDVVEGGDNYLKPTHLPHDSRPPTTLRTSPVRRPISMAISNDMPVSYKTSTDSSPSSLPVHEATGLRCTTESLSGPACYQIGSTMRTEPLVSVQYLKAHLCLLGAFKSLRNSVENAGDDQLPILALGLDKSQRWSWFVGLAVDRQVERETLLK